MKCPELRSLSKPPLFSSLVFRGHTPGSIYKLRAPGRHPKLILDQTHPGRVLPHNKFPKFNSQHLNIECRPYGLLWRPENGSSVHRPFKTWPEILKSKVENTEDDYFTPTKCGRKLQLPFSMTSFFGLKLSMGRPTVRGEVLRRLKTALNLVIIRGAVRDIDEKGEAVVKINDDIAMKNLENMVLQDWTYIFSPTIKLYTMPYPELVGILRQALPLICQSGKTLEKGWVDQSLKLEQQGPQNQKRQSYPTRPNKSIRGGAAVSRG